MNFIGTPLFFWSLVYFTKNEVDKVDDLCNYWGVAKMTGL